MIDMHSHILPGIDDGSQGIEESVQMLREAYEAGFNSVIATSHYIEESYSAKKAQREELMRMLQERLDKEQINVKIYNGAEAYITLNLKELIQEEKIPTMNDTRYVLIELPRHSEIIYLDSIILSLIHHGLKPIVAHPERYTYVQKRPKMLLNLIDSGVLFQSNYGSIVGNYGREAEKTVKKLLKNDMIHFLGTDCHRENSIYKQMPMILKKIEKLIGRERLEKLSNINPQKVLNDREIEV